MKLIIAGDRDFTDYDYLTAKFLQVFEYVRVTEIVSGAARGADRLGEELAAEYDIPLKLFPADWDRYPRAAGLLRNEEMASLYCFALN